MRPALIISALGEDRPGIVDRVSGVVHRHEGNIEDSRMANLGGKFALMVLVTGSPASLERIRNALPALADELELFLQTHPTEVEETGEAATQPSIPYRVTAVSMDHPGIVHRVSHVLASHGVNVAALETRRTLAPTTGTPVFSLSLEAEVPAELPVARLREALDALAEEENLDLELRAIQ